MPCAGTLRARVLEASAGLIHDRVEYLWGACGRQGCPGAAVQPLCRPAVRSTGQWW